MGQVLSSQVPLPFYQGLGFLAVPAVVISIEGCLNLALSIWFANLIGLTGVALATALPAVISLALLPPYLCRKLEVPLNQLFRSLVPGIVMLIGTIAVEILLATMFTSVSWVALAMRIAVTVPLALVIVGLMFPRDERETLSRMLGWPPLAGAHETVGR
jgi:peptidoglycan biosynthesis protein MviN/MurJ (putative lipid II flippase)